MCCTKTRTWMLLMCLLLLQYTMQPSVLFGQEVHRTVENFTKLVESLASRNEAPFFVEAGEVTSIRWPKGFDWKEQKRVQSVLFQANPKSGEEWEVLTLYLADKRYALTGYEKDKSTVRNYHVGELCTAIARAQLEHIYGEFIPVDRFDRPLRIVVGLPILEKDRGAKTLWELQSDVALRAAEAINDHPMISDDNKRDAMEQLIARSRELTSKKIPKLTALNWDGMTWINSIEESDHKK